MTRTTRRRFYGGPYDGKAGEILLLGHGAGYVSPPTLYLGRETEHPSVVGPHHLHVVPPPADHVLELHAYHLRQLHTQGPDGEGYRCLFYIHQALLDTWEDRAARILTDWLTELLIAHRPGNGDLLYLPQPGDHDGPA